MNRAAPVLAVFAALGYAVALAIFQLVPRYDCIALVVVLVAVFRLLDGENARVRGFALHAVTQLLVASFLVHLWTVGYEGRNAVFGGILPWSDSHDYYDDALRLAHGERFTEVSSKRPLFSAALAGILRISNGDLRLALVAFAIVGAWAVALATHEVWKTAGARSAFVVYLVLLFFERRWTGFIQTEHVGLPMGVVGFVLFWRANREAETSPERAQRLALVGLFAIATGLMARAGAFFVLPALALWAARKLVRPTERGGRARFLAMSAAAVIAGFAFHKSVLYATGSGVTFSDYPGIAYGLIHGEDYTYLGQTHPHLGTLGIAERVPEAWRIVLGDAKAHPLLVLEGLAKSGAGLFTSPFGIFGYVWTNPDDHVLENGAAVRAAMQSHGLVGPLWLWRSELGTYSLLNAGAMGAIGAALVLSCAWSVFVVFVRRRHDERLSLLRHAIAGVLLSAPFTPPWITSGQQVQTATLAFVAALPGVVLFGRSRADDPAKTTPRDLVVWAPFGFAAILAAVIGWMRIAPASVPPCSGAAHVVKVFPGSSVEVASARSHVFRDKAASDLFYSMRFLGKHNPELTDSVVPYIHVGTDFVSAFDACDRRAKILVDDGKLLASPHGNRRWQTIDADPLATARVLHVRPPPTLDDRPARGEGGEGYRPVEP